MHFQFSFSKSFSSHQSVGILGSIIGGVIGIIGLTVLGWVFLVKGLFFPSRVTFEVMHPLSATASFFSFHRIPLIEFWKETTWLGREGSRIARKDLDGYDFTTSLSHMENALEQLQISLMRKTFWKKSDSLFSELRDSAKLARLMAEERSAHKKYLVIFQNSGELRATGGFMGSYTILNFQQPDFWQTEMRDIYDPSGVSTTKDSPLGQKEYLSSGNGMRLHDANWSADFPQAASDILWFFQQIPTDSQTYDGVIAVNFSTIESFLKLVGPVYFADEGVWVSAHEVSQLIRADRTNFFPGSQQKSHKLQSFQTALMVKLESLSAEEWKRLMLGVLEQKLWREVQIFSQDSDLQQEFLALGLSGRVLSVSPDQAFLFPVESNVGINKANEWVSRSFTLENEGILLRYEVIFTNTATQADRPPFNAENPAYTVAPHLGYVNYYRMIFPLSMRVLSVQVGDTVLSEWNEEAILVSNGQTYMQVGFLVTVPEDSEKKVRVDFSLPENWDGTILVQKQTGMKYQSVLFPEQKNTIVQETPFSFFWSQPGKEAVQ